MRDQEYRDLIFEGIEYHKVYIKEFILRSLRKGESAFITEYEFINRLLQASIYLACEILVNSQLNFGPMELHNNFSKMLNKDVDLTLSNLEHISEAFPELSNADIGYIEKSSYSKTYSGRIFFSDIRFLINKIFEVSKEKNTDINLLNEIDKIELNNLKPKMLVLRELGVIKLLNDKFENNVRTAECLAKILNVKQSTVRPIISNIAGRVDNTSNPENIKSIESAIIFFNSIGCTAETIKLQDRLKKLNDKKVNRV